MKHYIVIISMLLYLGGISLAQAAQVLCPTDSGTVTVLLAKEKDDKKEGGEKNPEEDCE